ncbi:Allantoicase [Ophidiomyces ophidiicola]|nr:Allantoicase [Ophidiomyces ophidiicola]
MAGSCSPSAVAPERIDAHFAKATNVASAALHARIVAVSNEFFAPASNLLTPTPAVHRPGVFVATGAWYDGWETRRHNPQPFDWAVVRLGPARCVVDGLEVDTAYFVGNFAERVLVEAACIDTDDGIEARIQSDQIAWTVLLPEQPCGPSARHAWALPARSPPVTHVRLRMFPDGGIARLRVYGHAVPPPMLADDEVDEELSSALCGGVVVAASNQHFTPAANLLLPGRGVNMGDGWETARSRVPGHVDWAIVRLGMPGRVRRVEVDTKDFRGNFPRAVRVHAIVHRHGQDADNQDPLSDDARWVELVRGEPACQADSQHCFEGEALADAACIVPDVTHVKLTIVPDGGVKRFRVFGYRQNIAPL